MISPSFSCIKCSLLTLPNTVINELFYIAITDTRVFQGGEIVCNMSYCSFSCLILTLVKLCILINALYIKNIIAFLLKHTKYIELSKCLYCIIFFFIAKSSLIHYQSELKCYWNNYSFVCYSKYKNNVQNIRHSIRVIDVAWNRVMFLN